MLMEVNLNHLFVIDQISNALMIDQGVLAFYLKNYKLHSIFSTPVLPSWRTFRFGMNWQQWYFGEGKAPEDARITILPRFHWPSYQVQGILYLPRLLGMWIISHCFSRGSPTETFICHSHWEWCHTQLVIGFHLVDASTRQKYLKSKRGVLSVT